MLFYFNHTGKNSIGICVIFSGFKRYFLFLLVALEAITYLIQKYVFMN